MINWNIVRTDTQVVVLVKVILIITIIITNNNLIVPVDIQLKQIGKEELKQLV